MRIASLFTLLLLSAGCGVDDAEPGTTGDRSDELVTTAAVTVLATAGAPSALTTDGTALYWIDDVDHAVVRMAKGGGPRTVLATGAAPRTPWCLAVDATHVYWLDVDDGAVRRVPKAGGATETLASGEGDLYAIALDGSYVYWSSNTASGGRVRRRARWGGAPVTLATGSMFTALVVDPWFVYAADAFALGGANQIVRVPRGGGAKVVLASDEDALGLAGGAGTLYWKRFWTGDVRRGSTWMPGATTIASDGGGWGDLDVDARDVWWTTGPILHRVARSGGPGAVVAELPSWANSVALDGGNVYLALDAQYVEDVLVPGAIVRVTP